ncbi:MAG: FixH family protein [Caldilineaceae bacterium]
MLKVERLLAQNIRNFILTLFIVLFLASCGSSSGSTSDLHVSLASAPEGRNGSYLTVNLTDKDGKPVTDAKVGLQGDMTHAGMAPIIADAVSDDADGAADGVYRVPFAFNMAGDWVITVSIERNGKGETQEIKATVNETEVKFE